MNIFFFNLDGLATYIDINLSDNNWMGITLKNILMDINGSIEIFHKTIFKQAQTWRVGFSWETHMEWKLQIIYGNSFLSLKLTMCYVIRIFTHLKFKKNQPEFLFLSSNFNSDDIWAALNIMTSNYWGGGITWLTNFAHPSHFFW